MKDITVTSTEFDGVLIEVSGLGGGCISVLSEELPSLMEQLYNIWSSQKKAKLIPTKEQEDRGVAAVYEPPNVHLTKSEARLILESLNNKRTETYGNEYLDLIMHLEGVLEEPTELA